MADTTQKDPFLIRFAFGLRRFLDGMFNQKGGTYVGIATAVTFAFAVLDRFGETYGKTPEWWYKAPYGIYIIILITFAGSKTLGYFLDSKYNSEPGKTPEVKK